MEELVVDTALMDVETPFAKAAVEGFIRKVLEDLDIRKGEVSVTLCGDFFIEELNRTYRDRAEPTDVLSFSQNEGYYMENDAPPIFGDIVISLETVDRQARNLGISPEEELKRVAVHGILHLLGRDHDSNNEEEEPMLKQQEKMLTLYRGVHLV
ncbi:MAG: rRNA maturation RNase YbeY [Spirochaetaceae bacterium]